MTALLTHYGSWVQPPRRQDKGPAPKPRWMPVPQLLYAQVVKTVRRRRLVRVRHRVVFGTLETVNAVLAPLGCQINTAFIERLNLTIRQHVAAVGRRVSTLCKHEVSAPCQPPPASVTAPAHPWPWLGQNVATADTGHGRGADRSRLDAARGAPVSRAAVAPASGGMSTPWWWETTTGEGLRGDVRLHGRLGGRHRG